MDEVAPSKEQIRAVLRWIYLSTGSANDDSIFNLSVRLAKTEREIKRLRSIISNSPTFIGGDPCPRCGGTDFICKDCLALEIVHREEQK